MPLAVEVWSLNHWTSREVPKPGLYMVLASVYFFSTLDALCMQYSRKASAFQSSFQAVCQRTWAKTKINKIENLYLFKEKNLLKYGNNLLANNKLLGEGEVC